MPTIRPVSDLQTKTKELLHICAQEEQPIFLTQNGHGQFVMMSQDCFERMQAMARLYSKLDEAQQLAESGDKGISHEKMIRRMRARLEKRA